MEDFDKIISVIRSRDISVSLIIQSLSQLDSPYGVGKARTIINTCDHLLYMGGNDKDTLEYIAYRVNKLVVRVGLKPRDKMYLLTTGESRKVYVKTDDGPSWKILIIRESDYIWQVLLKN